jgi:cytochrome subunit of sulfide dehydrogenase
MRTRWIAASVAVVMAPAAVSPAAPLEPPAGASSCSGCHAVGSSVETTVPRLAGRRAEDIVAQMQAFKAGRQQSTIMNRIAKGFSDAEVQAIAAWYAQQQ